MAEDGNASAFLAGVLMHIVVLRSTGTGQKNDSYSMHMNTSYAERFLGHIMNRKGYCASCGDACIKCREHYDLDFSEAIVQVIDFPALLPVLLDDPVEYLPEMVQPHDILIALSVHEEILQSFLEKHGTASGVIVPIEEPWWVSPYARNRMHSICDLKGIEIAFPKPFCSFEPQEGVLREFRTEFRIGKPDIEYGVKDNNILDTRVRSSAPCGATYFVARNLKGKKVNNDLINVIDSLLSAYPCTASTEVDREFGDSIIHRAVQIQRNILEGLGLDSTVDLSL